METVDFIENIVSLMTPTLDIDSVVDNGNGTQTLTICKDIYWVRKYTTITIDGTDYEVSSFDKDAKTITIPSGTLVTASSFSLTAPYYFHGYPRQLNNQWLIERLESNKYPLVYLVETLTDNYYNEEDSREKDMNLRIFFLDSFTNKDDEVNAHYTNTIVPLKSMLNYFVELLNNDATLLPFDYDVINRIEVGVYTTDQGNTQKIFSDSLDGVEFVGTITSLKSNNCNNC